MMSANLIVSRLIHTNLGKNSFVSFWNNFIKIQLILFSGDRVSVSYNIFRQIHV